MPFSAAAYVVARSFAVLLGLWRHVVCRCECLPLRVRPDRQRSGGDEVSGNPGIQRGALCSRQTRARAEGPAQKAETKRLRPGARRKAEEAATPLGRRRLGPRALGRGRGPSLISLDIEANFGAAVHKPKKHISVNVQKGPRRGLVL